MCPPGQRLAIDRLNLADGLCTPTVDAYDKSEVRVNGDWQAVRMSRSDHHEFDLAVFKGPRRKSVASHSLDDRPIREKVLLRLQLRREFGLQDAALPRVPIRNLKRYRLGSLVDLLFGGLGKFPHTLFLYELSR